MIDQEKVKKAVRLLLEGIGEDADREGLIETPDRIARMCEEIYGGYEEDAKEHLCKTFHVENSDMVVEKDITFYSMCEHHLAPFFGVGACGVHSGIRWTHLRIVEARALVDAFAKRPQVQERLTSQSPTR